MALLDIKLFLRVSRAKAVGRREARDGYVTLEGFWKDPPGYVEKIVWPNYVEGHRWMFEGGRVEGGELDGEALGREGVLGMVGRGEDVEFGETLEWYVGFLAFLSFPSFPLGCLLVCLAISVSGVVAIHAATLLLNYPARCG
jgi:nicotinamide/nicotinate riboside kinase